MTRLAIIADDLTGAADSAAPFAARATTAVLVNPEVASPGHAVVAVNTETRNAGARQAVGAVRRAVQTLGEVPTRGIVKKVDSLMRGNVGAEIAAILSELRKREEARTAGAALMAVVAPAFPRVGRVTLDGQVKVEGKDIPSGDVLDHLASGGLSAISIANPAGDVAAPGDGTRASALAAALAAAAADGQDAVVVDAATDDDLVAVIRAVELLPGPVLLVGTGGITAALAATWDTAAPAADTGAGTEIGDHPLVVVGSYAPASARQVDHLVAAGFARIGVTTRGTPERAIAELRQALAIGPAVLTPAADAPLELHNAGRMAGLLAEVTGGALDSATALLISGGQTAHAILGRLGVATLTVLGEALPGVVASRMPGLPHPLITKSGAFGDASTLTRLALPASASD